MPTIVLDYTRVKTISSYIDSGGPGVSGNGNSLIIGNNGTRIYRSLLFFNLNLIPNNSIIKSATLGLTPIVTSPREIRIHRLTSEFNAATNWGNQPNFLVDYETSFISGPQDVKDIIDLTNLVQEWVDGFDNHGIIFEADDNLSNNVSQLAGSTFSTLLYRPTLTIEYEMPTEDKKQVEHISTNFNSLPGNGIYTAKISLPNNIVKDDMLISLVSTNNVADIQAPGWDVLSHDIYSGGNRFSVLTKRANGNETDIDLILNGNYGNGIITNHVYRNVKSIIDIGGPLFVGSTATLLYKNISGVPINSLLILCSIIGNTGTINPILDFNKHSDNTSISRTIGVTGTYNYKKVDYTQAELTTTSTVNAPWGIKSLVLIPITNEVPKIDGEDGHIGIYDEPVIKNYNVIDTEDDNVTIVERLDGNIIQSRSNIGSYDLDLTSFWDDLSIGKHTITIEVYDEYDPSRINKRTWTFKKILDQNSKSNEILRGVNELVPIFERIKEDFIILLDGEPNDTFDILLQKKILLYNEGFVRSSTTNLAFQFAGHVSTFSSRFVEVDDVGFIPEIVLLTGESNYARMTIIYSENNDSYYPKTVKLTSFMNTTGTDTSYNAKADISPAYINNGFLFPVPTNDTNYKWQAFGKKV